MLHDTAIMQMIFGERGNIDNIPRSKNYRDAADKFCDKYKEFTEKYADNPELLKLLDELNFAHDGEQAAAEEDCYVAGFSFGVLMGMDIVRINQSTDN